MTANTTWARCLGVLALAVLSTGSVSALAPLANVTTIGAGGEHSCAVTIGGAVKCWGDNSFGKLGLGNGDDTNRLIATNVSGLGSGVVAVVAGYHHTCALTSGGGVKCWGYNYSGQLGDGTTNSTSTPVDVVGLASGVTAIAAGRDHTCALVGTGGVKCWGGNGGGQLGDGTTTSRSTAVNAVGLGSGIAAIDAGNSHSCALTTSGGVKCWGSNDSGQLGDGTTTQRLNAVDVAGLTSGVASVSAGDFYTCAVTVAGGAKCWGGNHDGQLGDGTTLDRVIAVNVTGLTSGVSAITASNNSPTEDTINHTCALVAGGAKCWGNNSYGQLGDGTFTSRLTAGNVTGLAGAITSVIAGGLHTCARIVTGEVQCWGDNPSGQLGNGAPLQIPIAEDVLGLGNGVTAVALGRDYSCALLGGGVKCWGSNESGALGDGTTNNRSTPVDAVGLTSGVAAIAAGDLHTCALMATGAVKCWGRNNYGQLGDGTNISRSVAANVTGLASGVAAISAGEFHTCALMMTGGAKCWGYNGAGELGDGTLTDRTTPVNVLGLASGMAIGVGTYHSCALTTVGGVKCWGLNGNGQLGDGTYVDSSTPITASGLASGVAAIAAGHFDNCVLTAGGGVKCWGYNEFGQLGNGTTDGQGTAVNATGLSSGVTAIAASLNHTCARTSGGGVKCWGANSYGELGDGTMTGRLTAADVVGLASGIASIDVGGYHSCARTNAGGVKCWGYNFYGQLGNGEAAYSPLPVTVLEDNGPTVNTNPASGITMSVATLNGTITSNGATTAVTFQYGQTTSYGNLVAAVPSPLAAGAANVAVSAMISSLFCGTSYHFRAVGVNVNGTVNGSDGSFTTSPCPVPPPTVVTNAATVIAMAGATLNGTVTSNGSMTTVTFQYGLTTGYGSTATSAQSPLAAGATNAPVSAAISGLACNTPYHFRAVGVSVGGTTNGTDVTFTTAACPTTVITNAATAITTTGATLNGMASSNGASTAVVFQYGPTTGYGTTTTAAPSPLAANAVNAPFSVAISGLDCGATYHFRAVGGNTAGSINGADLTFTAAACVGTSTRIEIAPSAPLTFVATVVSNKSGKVRFTDEYYPDTPLTNYTCAATPVGNTGGSCSALSSCSQTTLDNAGHASCVVALSCLAQQPGCHYITAKYEGGTDPTSTSTAQAYPVIPPAPATVNSATGGNGDSSVSFKPTENGGPPVTSYTVVAAPVGGTGDTVTATIAATAGVDRDAGSLSTTHVVAGLANGVSYSFQVIANNEFGAGPASMPSNAVAPMAATLSAYSLNYIQKVYVAYYGRPADPAGQDYWAGLMDSQGQSLGSIIAAFGNSEEFNRRYGGLTAAQLITRIYQQTLGRDPDPAGLAYYVGELLAGNRTLQTITLDVLNGASTAPDATVVSNRLTVASYYTDLVAAGCEYGTEQTGVDALSIVTAGAPSVAAAKALIDARCGL